MDDTLARFKATGALDSDYARPLIVRSDTLIDTNDNDAAVSAAREALATARRVKGPEHRMTLWAMTSLGQALDMAEMVDESLAVTGEALRVTRRVAGGNERDPLVIDARMAYAKALGGTGRYDLASDAIESAIRDAAVLHGERSVEVGIYHQNAAVSQLKAGRIRAGIESAAQAIEIRGGAVAEGSTESLFTRNVYARGLLLGRRGREALPILAGMLEGIVALFGPSDVRTLEVRSSYALALASTGALIEAASAADAVVADAQREKVISTHRPWYVRGMIFRLQGNAREAVAYQSLALRNLPGQASLPDRAEVLAELGTAQALSGDRVSGERNLLKSIEVLDTARHAATPVRADAHAWLARLRLEQGRAQDALPFAEQADEFWRGFDAENPAAGEAALWLGRARLALGQRQEADASLRRARNLLARSPLPGDAALLAQAAPR